MRPLLLLTLSACALDPLDAAPVEPWAVERAASPPVLEVSPLQAGGTARFTVRGAPAGATVRVYGTASRGGAPTCPPELGGACLTLSRASFLGQGVAEPTGVATIRKVLPSPAPPRVGLQAAVTWMGVTQVSAVVGVPIAPPAPDSDGDGIPDALDVEACDGLDNDGDAAVDEGFDADLDGVADCFEGRCDVADLRYTFIEGNTAIVRVDPQTGAELNRLVAPSGVAWTEVIQSPDGQLYTLGTAPAPTGAFRWTLATLDLATGASTAVASWPEGLYVDGAAFDAQGDLWIVGVSALLRARHGTWELEIVREAAAWAPVIDIAWADGTLYVARGVGAQAVVTRADLSTGVLTPVTPAPAVVGLDTQQGALYALGRTGGMVRIHPSTGAATVLDPRVRPVLTSLAMPLGPCPTPQEICDGTDDDDDGLTDEGYDRDRDGLGDCFDVEACDGLDNDADGATDEGFDADADGIADCLDACPNEPGTTQLLFSTYTGALGTYDPRTAVSNGLGTPDRPLTDVARLADGRLYGAVADGSGVLVDAASGDLTYTTRFYNTGASAGADPGGGVWLGNGLLDPDTGVLIGGYAQILVTTIQDLVIDGGVQWTVERTSATTTALRTRDVVSGALLSSVPLTVQATGLAVADGVWYVSDARRIYLLDRATGATTPVFDTGSTQVTGLTDWPAPCPIPPEVCNGVDDNGDGVVDEGQPDTDGDGLCDGLDSEVCDGLDNDGDGATDEGFDLNQNGIPDCVDEPCNCQDDNGDGRIDELCTFELGMISVGTGQWETWLDGAFWAGGATATGPAARATTVGGGFHTIAAKIDVDGAYYPGFLADVFVNGNAVAPTGAGGWTVSPTSPAPGWQLQSQPQPAQITGVAYPAQPGFLGSGAQWVWSNLPDPVRYSGNWYVIELLVCGEQPWPATEVCNGLDDDGDGGVDEGFPDDDRDGVPACFEAERTCDGQDEDGDGFIDEGFPDRSGDGMPDCE